MGWDDKLLQDINALVQKKPDTPKSGSGMDKATLEAAIQASMKGKSAPTPPSPPKTQTPPPPPEPEKKPLDMSAIEAQILASMQGKKTGEASQAEPTPPPRPEPEVTVEPAHRPEPEPEQPRQTPQIIDVPVVRDPEPETAPDPAPGEKKGFDMSAFEAAIQKSLKDKSTPAAEPAAKPEPVPEPAPEEPAAPEAPEVPAEDPAEEPIEPIEPIGLPEEETLDDGEEERILVDLLPVEEPEPEPEPEPELTREDVMNMASERYPGDMTGEEERQLLWDMAGRMVPGYLQGMHLEDALLRCSREFLDQNVRSADADTLLLLLKFLLLEQETARDGETVPNMLETVAARLLELLKD